MAEAQQDLLMIVEKLNDTASLKDIRLLRSCIYEVLTLATHGCDVTPSLPTIVKLLAHGDTFVKRVAGELISIYADQKPDLVLLATNTLVQDCKDMNPVVRGHGLHMLGSLASSSTVEMLNCAVTEALEDSSPYVRKYAAQVSTKLYQVCPISVTESGIWDSLYSHLSDQDSVTVASCLCALEEIFAREKGIVVSNKLGHFLISRFSSFTPTVQRFLLQFLLKYTPKSKAQVFEHLNDLDESLSKSSSVVTTLSCLELFCHLASGLPKVESKAYGSAWLAIKMNLARECNEEMVTAVIDYLCTTNFPASVIVQDYNKFFCRDDDSVFLVKQKIRMLSRLITIENVENILEELLRSARHLEIDTLREMVHTVREVMTSSREIEAVCVDFLRKLLQLGKLGVLDCVIQMLPTMELSDDNLWSTLAPSIQDSYGQISSLSGKISLLEIIQAHGNLLENAPEILEQMMLDLEDEHFDQDEKSKHPEMSNQQKCYHCSNKQRLKITLLAAMGRLCMVKPAKVQPLLARLMECSIEDPNRSVRDRALMLYGYLLGRTKDLS